MMGTEIFKIDASWAEKLTKTRVQFLLTPTVFINTRWQTHCRTLNFPAESPVIMMCSFQLWIHQIGLSAPSINTLHYTIYNYLHRCHDSHLGLSKNEISCSDQQPAIFLSPSPLSPAPTLALQFSISHFRVAQWGA